MGSLSLTLRSLWRRRWSAGAVIATLALAIGANAIVATAVRAVTRAPGYPNGHLLMHIQAVWSGGAGTVAYVDYEALRDRSRAFSEIAAYASWGALTFRKGDGVPSSVDGSFVTPSYLNLVGARPLHGRLLVADDNLQGASRAVVLLGNGLWTRVFGGDSSAIGQSIDVNGKPHEIVGVLAPSIKDPGVADGLDPQLFLPADRITPVGGLPPLSTVARRFWVMALRHPDISVAQAQAEALRVSNGLQKERPDTHRGFDLRATTLTDRLQGALHRPALALSGVALLLMCIAVANVANLFLIRVADCRRDLALRLAMGASLGQVKAVVRREVLVLLGIGCWAGLLLASALLRVLRPWLETEVAPFATFSIDWQLVGGCLLVIGVVVAFVASTASLGASRLGLRESVMTSSRSTPLRSGRWGHVGMTAQIAVALVAFASAALIVRSFVALTQTPLGYRTERLLTFRLDLASPTLPDALSRFRFVELLLSRLRATLGVESASVWGPSMLGNAAWVNLVAPDTQALNQADALTMAFRHNVDPGGLRAPGIELLAGRSVLPSDTLETPLVGVISESLARRLWPGDPASAIGRSLVRRAPNPPVQVVGVARDALHRQRYSFADIAEANFIGGIGPQLDIYFPFTQRQNDTLATFALRLSDGNAAMAETLREIVRSLNGSLALSDVEFLDNRIARQERSPRALAVLMVACAALVSVLCALGVYAVVAYDVARRRREIGVRVAIGASSRAVARSVVVPNARALGLGVAIGSVAAVLCAQSLRSVLFGIEVFDPTALVGVVIALAVTILLALIRPIVQATRVDPVELLRAE